MLWARLRVVRLSSKVIVTAVALLMTGGCVGIWPGRPGPIPLLSSPSTLHEAADQGTVEALECKLEEPGSLEARDREGRTPLMAAAYSGAMVTPNVRLLLERGADVNARDPKGRTPLMFAVMSMWHHAHGGLRPVEDSVERARVLIEAGADVNARDNAGLTVLMVTASASAFESTGGKTCELLLRSGAEVDARDPSGRTAMMYAAGHAGGDIPVLLAHGADINAQDNEGRTPAMHLFDNRYAWGNIDRLLAGDPDLEIKDKKGRTVLAHAAFEASQYRPVQTLLRAGAKGEALGWTPLHAAAITRDSESAYKALQSGADPNAKDVYGRTPLMWASAFIAEDRNQTLHMLLSRGARVDERDNEGATALHIAAAGAWMTELETLIDAGAPIDARDSAGRTALMWAAAGEHGRFRVELLLKRGADPFAKDNSGRTALDLAYRDPFEDSRPDSGDLLRAAMKLPRDTSKRW